ncbi:hypothetical protein [Oleiagrimonas sp. C23AA]|uniref:hypothetical protein n=1 Tax=Oleiagrimonas sp. C23AA TaxID=2719047 RepID=UPI0014224F92|nr:hypothetical protein [Oleiagrimonas sp. C23AA]NII12045.1 hypothetical protein [Oleiagrimonas sp. C23AA]
MIDRPHHDPDQPAYLGALLRSLPQVSPPHDAFALVAARARRRRMRRRAWYIALPLAAAASLALVVMLVQRPPTAGTATGSIASAPSHPTGHSIDREARIAALQVRSQRLEAWLRQLRAGSVMTTGQDLATQVQLRDQLAAIDVQLGQSDDASQRESLWRQRVERLRSLATLQLAQGALADTSTSAHGHGHAANTWID